jgi:hypothetical protein
LYKLTEAISHYSDEDGIILATVADEGEASSSPILEELKELHTASGSRTVVRKQRRK